MPKFQLLGCKINVGGDRNTVVVRDEFDPITYPEYLVLQALHGGEEHVFDPVVVGERETHEDERDRLALKYGSELVLSVFPGALRVLPVGDDTIPTLEEVAAVAAATKEAREKVRAKKDAKAAPFGGKGDHDGDGTTGGSKASRKSKTETTTETTTEAPAAADDGDTIPDLTGSK